MIFGFLALPEWNEFMDAPSGAWLGFIISIQSLSSFLVYPFLAWTANCWGRKPGIYIGYFFLLVGVFLQGFAPSAAAFIVSRALLGQVVACWSGLAPLLITELAYPPHRAFFTSLYECNWYIGSTLAAWVTYGTRNYGSHWVWGVSNTSCLLFALFAAIPELLTSMFNPRREIWQRNISRCGPSAFAVPEMKVLIVDLIDSLLCTTRYSRSCSAWHLADPRVSSIPCVMRWVRR